MAQRPFWSEVGLARHRGPSDQGPSQDVACLKVVGITEHSSGLLEGLLEGLRKSIAEHSMWLVDVRQKMIPRVS